MSEPWRILQGDVRHVLRELPANHFDGLLSDPPYGLSFMGKRWDYDVPSPIVWAAVVRVLKPGAHGIIFGGTRTFHRLAVNVEDGGFEPRDLVMWLYGSGFPKSHDVSKAIVDRLGKKREVVGTKRGVKADGKGGHGAAEPNVRKLQVDLPVTAPSSDDAKAWNGYGTALKPAVEPAMLVRKYLDGTVAENALKWGTGGLAIDASRVGDDERVNPSASSNGMWSSFSGNETSGRPPVGRWPANVVLDEEAASVIDAQSGHSVSRGGVITSTPTALFGKREMRRVTGVYASDSGGASRFFYTAKAPRYERESGCDSLALKRTDSLQGGGEDANDPVSERFTKDARNVHPTVKPLDLARYMARLILPPKRSGHVRRLLVPFSGSGSEIIGALQAGWDEVVGIEREAEYIRIATARIQNGGVFSTLHREKRKATK